MKTRLLLSSLLIALSTTSFAQTHKAHWSYNGKESPEHWGDLLTEYQTCKLGKVQSPVNLEADNGMKVANKPLKMNSSRKQWTYCASQCCTRKCTIYYAQQ